MGTHRRVQHTLTQVYRFHGISSSYTNSYSDVMWGSESCWLCFVYWYGFVKIYVCQVRRYFHLGETRMNRVVTRLWFQVNSGWLENELEKVEFDLPPERGLKMSWEWGGKTFRLLESSKANKKKLEPEPGLVLTLSLWWKTKSNLDIVIQFVLLGHCIFVQVHFTTDKIRPSSVKIFFSGTWSENLCPEIKKTDLVGGKVEDRCQDHVSQDYRGVSLWWSTDKVFLRRSSEQFVMFGGRSTALPS